MGGRDPSGRSLATAGDAGRSSVATVGTVLPPGPSVAVAGVVVATETPSGFHAREAGWLVLPAVLVAVMELAGAGLRGLLGSTGGPLPTVGPRFR